MLWIHALSLLPVTLPIILASINGDPSTNIVPTSYYNGIHGLCNSLSEDESVESGEMGNFVSGDSFHTALDNVQSLLQAKATIRKSPKGTPRSLHGSSLLAALNNFSEADINSRRLMNAILQPLIYHASNLYRLLLVYFINVNFVDVMQDEGQIPRFLRGSLNEHQYLVGIILGFLQTCECQQCHPMAESVSPIISTSSAASYSTDDESDPAFEDDTSFNYCSISLIHLKGLQQQLAKDPFYVSYREHVAKDASEHARLLDMVKLDPERQHQSAPCFLDDFLGSFMTSNKDLILRGKSIHYFIMQMLLPNYTKVLEYFKDLLEPKILLVITSSFGLIIIAVVMFIILKYHL